MIMNKILLNINSEIKDLRMKKQSSMVEDLGIYLSDKDEFIKKAQDNGFRLLGDNFLIKEINGKEYNLTIKDEEISTLTIYENNESVDITDEDIDLIKEYINKSI